MPWAPSPQSHRWARNRGPKPATTPHGQQGRSNNRRRNLPSNGSVRHGRPRKTNPIGMVCRTVPRAIIPPNGHPRSSGLETLERRTTPRVVVDHEELVHLVRNLKRRLRWMRLACWAVLILGRLAVADRILNGVPSSNRTPSALLLGLAFALLGVATARLPETLAFSSRDARRALVLHEIHDCLRHFKAGTDGDLSIAYRHLEARLIADRPITATRSARRYYRTHYAASSTMVGDFERDLSRAAQGRSPDERPDARQERPSVRPGND